MVFLLLFIIPLASYLTPAPAMGNDAEVQAHAFATNLRQAHAGWTKYNGSGEEFSVMLPAPPSGLTSLITDRSGKRRVERAYSAYADGVVYVILSYDKTSRKESIEDILNDFKQHHLFGGELSFASDLNIDGIHGKRFHLKLNYIFGVVQVLITDKHAYVIEGVSANPSNPAVRHFLSSFTLGGHSSDGTVASSSSNGVVDNTAPVPTPATSSSTDEMLQSAASGGDSKQVTRRAVVVFRPEPVYTEAAHHRNIEGIVKLRVVLASSGEVTNITPLRTLPDGLTETAIKAARNLRFIPAVKDGRFVPQYAQIEYHFGLY